MSQLTMVNRSQLLAAATAISAVGLFVTVSPPAQAHPVLPLAPACSQWGFPGVFTLKQTNGDLVRFNSTGPVASGQAEATTPDREQHGYVQGGSIQGDKLDFTLGWSDVQGGPVGVYTGVVGSDGFAHGETRDRDFGETALWDSTVRLVCTTPAASASAPASAPAPAAPPAPPAVSAAADLTMNDTGPTTLQTGLTGTYRVLAANSGNASVPAQVTITFTGNLDVTDDPINGGGFDCAIQAAAGVTRAVVCTGQLAPGPPTVIEVRARGSAPGTGVFNSALSSPGSSAQHTDNTRITVT
jgi:hypothetical protein